MQQLKYKTKRTYVVVPNRQARRVRRGVTVAKLRKEITRAWRGPGAVEEIQAQRKR